MTQIGIDQDSGFIYEGRSNWGHPIWPAPMLSPAAVASSEDRELKPVSTHDLLMVPLMFREDSFDPVSRVRRGRLYERVEMQPAEWFVLPHPAVPDEYRKSADAGGHIRKRLATFRAFSLRVKFPHIALDQPLILLGMADRFTVWTLVSIEFLSSGDELLVLKARQSLGSLPDLREDAIPDAGHVKVRQALEKLADEIYRAGPESVVDRARDVLSVVLAEILRAEGANVVGKDLGKLISLMENQQPRSEVVTSAAKIVARLHARAKPVEQEKRQLPDVVEQDAELAVSCVGTILRDLGWAEWR